MVRQHHLRDGCGAVRCGDVMWGAMRFGTVW